jgi:hypothetical protein
VKIKFTKLIMVSIIFSVLFTSCVNDKEKPVETQQTSTTVQTETSEATSKQTTTVQTEASQATPKQNIDMQTETSKTMQKQTTIQTETIHQKTVTQSANTSPIITTTRIPEATTRQITTIKENEDDNLCEMPEIVFILAYYHWDYDNSYGYYINNKGLIKSFDFTKTAPDEFYYIGDLEVYNMIDSIGTDTDFDPIPKEKLTDLYEKLLKVDDNSEVKHSSDGLMRGDAEYGDYGLYGARFNSNKELEIVWLGEYGNSVAVKNDSYANELFEELKLLIPDPRTYLN